MTIGTDSLGSFAFTGADGSALGGGWTDRQGAWTIQSNQASYVVGQGVPAMSCYNNINRGNDNYRVAFALGNLGDGTVKGVMLRRSNGTGLTNNAYVLGVDDVGHAFIWLLANDVVTTVVDGGYQASNFDGTFQAEADGSTLTLKNGAGTVLATASDATYVAGSIGLFTNRTTSLATPFDSIAITGTAAGSTGSGAANESTPDTASSTGAVTVAGTGASTESSSDTASSSGTTSAGVVALSSLPEKVTLDGTEMLAIEDGGAAEKVSTAGIRRFLGDAFAVLSADYNLSNQTAAQKCFNHSPNGTLTLPVGTYHLEVLLYVTGMSGTSGNAQFDLKGAGTAVISPVVYSATGVDSSTPGTAAAQSGSLATAVGSSTPIVTAATGNAMAVFICGTFTVTSAGTIIPSIALTTAAAAVMKAGSFIKVKTLGSANYGGAWS